MSDFELAEYLIGYSLEFTLLQDFYLRDKKQWTISCSDHCKAKASDVADGFVTGSDLMEGIIID
eukprot:3719760-Rhodomonas_salina.1